MAHTFTPSLGYQSTRSGGFFSSDDPIRYEDQTFFPKNFATERELRVAYKEINDSTGWTSEKRGSRRSYVGEHDNGRYKIRIALQPDKAIPKLITAYPVSN